jgi:O-antigen ligase
MRRVLLLSLFALLLLSEMLGWKPGLGTGFSLKNVFLYVLVLLAVLEIGLGGGRPQPRLVRIHGLFLGLIALGFFSWLFTDPAAELPRYGRQDRLVALKGLLIDHYLFFISFYYAIRSPPDAVRTAKAILLLVFLGNLVTVIDVYDIPDLGLIKQMEAESVENIGRVSGPIGEPNQYASFLDLFLPSYVALALAQGAGVLRRSGWAVAGLLTFVILLLTGSRGGVAGLLVGGLLCLNRLGRIIRFRETFRLVLAVVPLIGVAVAIAAAKYADLLLARVEVTTEADAVTASAGRLWIWETGLSVMARHPESFLFGMGWHTFAPYVGVVPHNNYLWYFFNLGAVGLLLYLLILWNIYRLVREALPLATGDTRRLLLGFLFGFFALLVSVSFVDLFAPWFFIWAYIGLMARASSGVKESGEWRVVSGEKGRRFRQGFATRHSIPVGGPR